MFICLMVQDELYLLPILLNYVLICMVCKNLQRCLITSKTKQSTLYIPIKKQFWWYLLNISHHIFTPLAFQQPCPCPFQISLAALFRNLNPFAICQYVGNSFGTYGIFLYIKFDSWNSVQHIRHSPRDFDEWLGITKMVSNNLPIHFQKL